MISWFIVLFLLAANALYVAAEFAAVSLPKSRVKPLAERGYRTAQSLLYFLEDRARLDRYIAACQVGITWSSLVLGAFGQAAFAWKLAAFIETRTGLQASTSLTIASISILVLLTLTQMVLSELVPKSLALHNPLRTGMFTIRPMRWSLFAYSWFIDFLNGSGTLILRILGSKPAGHGHVHSPHEIEMLLSESEKGGELNPEEEDRLLGALKLGTRPVSHLMTPRVMLKAADLNVPPAELLELVTKTSYTRLPVYANDGEQIEGILFAKDVLQFYLENERAPSVAEIMRPALFVPEQMTADRLYGFFREHNAHLAIVVDEFGSVLGLVTLDDLMAEMLGDMPDEFKRLEARADSLADGRVRLSGHMRVEDAEEYLGSAWEGEAATVGGMVMELIGRLPVPGEKANAGGAEIEVEKLDGRRVASVLVRPAVKAEAPDA
jgi:putative hemolysin